MTNVGCGKCQEGNIINGDETANSQLEARAALSGDVT